MRIVQTLYFRKAGGGYHFTLKLDECLSEDKIVKSFDAALSSLGDYGLIEEKLHQYLVNSEYVIGKDKYAEFKFFKLSDGPEIINLSVIPLALSRGKLERILATIILPGLQPCHREQLSLFQSG